MADKFHLTTEQIKQIIKLGMTPIAFGISYAKNEDVPEIIEFSKECVNEIKTGEDAPDVNKLVDDIIEMGKIFAAGSDNKLDDEFVELADLADKVRKGEAQPIELLMQIFKIIAAARALKKENKAKKAE